MTEYIVRLLADHYKVAVLSRGYGRKTHGFVLAGPSDNHTTIGDEPMLLHTHFPEVPVAVCADRVEGVKRLLKLIPDLQCIILDDAFQHRRLRAGFNILLTAYDNLYVHDHMMPHGLLRDLPAESRRANIVVVTKCPERLTPIDRRIVSNQLRLASYQHLCYAFTDYQPLQLPGTPLVVAGIANPQPLIDHVRQYYPAAELLAYADHHSFSKKDILYISKRATKFACVLTTEKDYMRLQHTPLAEELSDKLFVLPIQTNLGVDQELFNRQLLMYVSESNRKLNMK
jgi:tetraacyldisaccharide 4'-kinase